MKQEMKYERVPIRKIHTEKQFIRAAQDDDHVIELASSISVHGLLEPIVVTKRGDGEYDLAAGAHRLAACKRLGWDTIPAMIREKKEAEPLKGIALIENVVRKDLTIEEEMRAVRYLYEEEKLSPSQICQLLSKGRRWVDARLAALEYPEDVRQALIEERISLAVAEVLAGIQDSSLRAMLLNAAITGRLPAREVEEMRRAYESAENFPEAVEAGLQAAREIALKEPALKACEICGMKRTYLHLRPMFVCVDREECLRRCEEKEREERAEVV